MQYILTETQNDYPAVGHAINCNTERFLSTAIHNPRVFHENRLLTDKRMDGR